MSFNTVPKATKVVLTNEEITGPAAREMVRLADIDERSVVLDNATGGGVVAIASKAKYAVDIDDSMLSLARSRGLQLRLLKPDGIAGFTSWEFIGWWPEVVTELPLSLPNPLDLFPSKWNDPDVVHEKLVKAGYAEIQAVEYSFQPRVEIERFAKAATVLINTVAKRVWCEEDFARYSPVIESIILKKWRDMYGEIWNGKMTALITIGRKPNSKMIER